MTEIFFELIPKKYRTIGHFLIGLGGFLIIFGMIYWFNYINTLGHCCLLMGISGTYFRKIRYFGSANKSEKFVYKKYLIQKYGFYIILIVGIIIVILQTLMLHIQFSKEFDYELNLIDFIKEFLIN